MVSAPLKGLKMAKQITETDEQKRNIAEWMLNLEGYIDALNEVVSMLDKSPLHFKRDRDAMKKQIEKNRNRARFELHNLVKETFVK
jgi:hypothetical protein